MPTAIAPFVKLATLLLWLAVGVPGQPQLVLVYDEPPPTANITAGTPATDYVDHTEATGGCDGTHALAFTPEADSDKLVALFAYEHSATSTGEFADSVTWNTSESCTPVVQESGTSFQGCEIWRCDNPTVTSANLEVAFGTPDANDCDMIWGVVALQHSQTGDDAAQSNEYNGNDSTQVDTSIASVSGGDHMIVDVVSYREGGSGAPDSPQVEIIERSETGGWDLLMVASTETASGTASNNQGWDITPDQDPRPWAHCVGLFLED